MVELKTVARPYAEALFDVAEDSDIDVWNGFVIELKQIASLPDFLYLASNPRVSRQHVVELLLAAVKSPLAKSIQAKNFIQMLVDNHRITLIPEIEAHFKLLKNLKEGVADAMIISAFPLNSADLERLIHSLERKFKHKLKPKVKVDSSLIGGICVNVGNEVLDMSVRARLTSMKYALAIV